MSKKIMSRVSALVLSFVMMFSPMAAFTGSVTGFAAENIEKWDADVIEISSEKDLGELAGHCHEDGWSKGKTVKLTADITLKGDDFTYIPYFNGTFNGGGYSIRNYEYKGNGFIVGFFRYIGTEGVVKNLDIYGTVASDDDDEAVGDFCGVNNGTVVNCSFRGNVSGKTQTGGMAGINDASGVIKKCTCSGRIKGYYYTGGLAGENRGIIKESLNTSNVNDNSDWVEENDAIGLDILTQIASNETTVKVESGTDTGGIAGYSTGVIADSINDGVVGYSHTGYNIGGICGRTSGVILSCTNNGKVYGRKDIGGIAGQQEPDIRMQKTGTLTKEVDRLHELVEKLLDDIEDANIGLNDETDELKSYADGTTDSAGKINDIATQYVNDNTEAINSLLEEADYVMDAFPAVLEELKSAMDEAAGTNGDVEKLTSDIKDASDAFERDYTLVSNELTAIYNDLNNMSKEADNISKQVDKIYSKLDKAYKTIQTDTNEIKTIIGGYAETETVQLSPEDRQRISDLLDEILSVDLPKADGPEVTSINESVSSIKELNEDMSVHAAYLDTNSDVMVQNTSTYTKIISDDVQKVSDDLEAVFTHLSNAVKELEDILIYVNALDDVSFSYLGDDFTAETDNLKDQLDGVTESLKHIADVGSDYGTVIDSDLKLVNDQVNVIYNLVASEVDEMEISESDSLKDYYKEVEEDRLDDITAGRMDHCVNNGVTEGDINVGGIVGAMSVDTDDQEENAAGNVSFRLNYEYTTACLVNGCKNYGKVTAKKDGAGGISGFVKIGAVRGCESYGWISSTEGGFVGGIVGESTGTVLSCYSICRLEGAKNVGGIAGYALTIKNSCSMVDLLDAKARFGAIAGQIAVEEDNTSVWAGVVSGNSYVSDEVYGIDNIGYENAADKITYKELLSQPGLPEDFKHLKVIFMIEDEILEESEFEYGAESAEVVFPEFPEREGCYGVWGEITRKKIKSNIYVEGEYHDIISTLPAESTVATMDDLINEKRILAYAEGNFTENTMFTAKVSYDDSHGIPEEKKDFVVYDVELGELELENRDQFPVRIYNPYTKVSVYELKDGTWQSADFLNRGGYIQVTMQGRSGTYAVVDTAIHVPSWVYIACACAAGLLVLIVFMTIVLKLRKHRAGKEPKADK
ncbi:MAG: hypothetical protein IKQ56_01305 [Lachnospiraceae bacterium]|nr:hypothetical protein [Lachnospiraceae bacterium]